MSHRPSLLAVDDEARGRELVRRILLRVADVELAESGEQAWEKFQRTRFDLVVSDQRMPGMTGVELFARIAECAPETGRILFTGFADPADTICAINEGRVHAYLTKPCPPDQLRVTVASVLEWSGVRLENRRLAAEQRERQRALEAERLLGVGAFLQRTAATLAGGIARIQAVEAEAGHRELGGLVACHRDIEERAQLLLGADRRELCDFDEVVASATSERVESAAASDVVIDVLLESGARLLLDRARIRWVVHELIHNALVALAQGGRIRVRTERRGAEVTLTVSDDGEGVPEALRDLVFEAFVSGVPGDNPGLGLSLVGKVARDHEGRAECISKPGKGSEFALSLPLPDEAEPRTPATEAVG